MENMEHVFTQLCIYQHGLINSDFVLWDTTQYCGYLFFWLNCFCLGHWLLHDGIPGVCKHLILFALLCFWLLRRLWALYITCFFLPLSWNQPLLYKLWALPVGKWYSNAKSWALVVFVDTQISLLERPFKQTRK